MVFDRVQSYKSSIWAGIVPWLLSQICLKPDELPFTGHQIAFDLSFILQL